VKEKEKHTCVKRIYKGWGFKPHACGKGAAYEHEGAWYCKTHHPPTMDAKDKAQRSKWDAEYRAKEKARDAAEATQKAIVHDAACWRKLKAVAGDEWSWSKIMAEVEAAVGKVQA